jgi:membrane-associated phospholipid phosphatase
VTQRAQDAFAMQALSAKFDAFAASDAATRSKLNDLVKNNAQVRDHRNVPLPVDLQRLLNSPDDTGPNANPSGKANAPSGASAALSAALATPASYEWRRGGRLVSVAIGCAILCSPYGCGYRLVQA